MYLRRDLTLAVIVFCFDGPDCNRSLFSFKALGFLPSLHFHRDFSGTPFFRPFRRLGILPLGCFTFSLLEARENIQAILAVIRILFSGSFCPPFSVRTFRTPGVSHGKNPIMQQDHVNFHTFPRFRDLVFSPIFSPFLSNRSVHEEQMTSGTNDFVATGLTRSTPRLGRRTQTPTTTGTLTHSHTNTQNPERRTPNCADMVAPE